MNFDLNPGEDVGWPQVQEARQLVSAELDELDLANFLKTSGGKRLHGVYRSKAIYGFDAVKEFSQATVNHLASVIAQRLVAKNDQKNRIGKIFVDDLHNGFGANTESAWSARACPGPGTTTSHPEKQSAAMKTPGFKPEA